MLTESLRQAGASLALARQRGLSIVELLVGVAVGLFLVAGAASLFVANLANSRKMLVEARVNQDLRAAADLITRDLRRTGYWANAIQGTVVALAASAPPRNVYAPVTTNVGASTIEYTYAQDTNNTVENTERFGFRLNAGAVDMKVANVWQTVTDPSVLTVTALTIAPTETPVDIRDSCAKLCCDAAGVAAAVCTAGQLNMTTPPACPTTAVRQYNLTLTGRATADSAVTRTLQTRVRLRNDLLAGACPA